ncbi:MAG: hypothetical protein AMJ90_09700, partial [candidate division Zixibacteria bacterium SM23_73_2]
MREKNLVLGVDPGSSRTGFGLILSDNENFKLLDYGTISTSKNDKLPQKLKRIYQGLLRIIREKKPDALVVEDAFYKKNAKALLVMGQIKGAVILAGMNSNLPVWEYTPTQVKSAVVGMGSASKVQVQYMVKNLLGLKEFPEPKDASDALAVALCHLQRREP